MVNASDLRIGDTLYPDGEVAYPTIPTLIPELFAGARARDTSRYKQFRSGLGQMEQEGVVQVLRDPRGDPTPVLAAVGQMQFEVFTHRLQHEFGAAVELSALPFKVARRTDEATAEHLRPMSGVIVLVRRDGVPLALFESEYWLQRMEADHPDWCLERILTGPR